jgi:hypothetical protein
MLKWEILPRRQELADLEASGGGSGSPHTLGATDSDEDEGETEAFPGQPFEKSMLDECRCVDEYDPINEISGEHALW